MSATHSRLSADASLWNRESLLLLMLCYYDFQPPCFICSLAFPSLTEKQRTFVKEQHTKKAPGFFTVCIFHPLPCCLDKFSASCSHEQKASCFIGRYIKNQFAIVETHEGNTDFYHCPPCYFASQSKNSSYSIEQEWIWGPSV